jgi:hypothetical protein
MADFKEKCYDLSREILNTELLVTGRGREGGEKRRRKRKKRERKNGKKKES